MTAISLDLRQAMADEQTDAVAITLVTIAHASLPTPIRLSSDRSLHLSEDPLIYGTRSRGNDYLWVPMSIIWPGDTDQLTAEARLVIDILDREVMSAVRATGTRAVALLELVQDSSPDLVEMSVGHLELRSAPYDEATVELVLSQEDFWGESWPARRQTPILFPGLHR